MKKDKPVVVLSPEERKRVQRLIKADNSAKGSKYIPNTHHNDLYRQSSKRAEPIK